MTQAPRARSAAPAGRAAPPRGVGRTVGWIGVLTACQAALLVGAGLLVTGPARHLWPMTAEDDVVTAVARMRTPVLTALSSVASGAGDTLTVVTACLACCLGLVVVPRLPLWRQAVFLALAVSLQSLVFLVVTAAVERHRPDVDRLDGSLPTSSYTSGHTGAATALYGGLAVLALTRLRGPWRRAAAALLLVIPLLVGVARIYRGMHHPTDIVGGLVNGCLSLVVARHAVLAEGHGTARAAGPPAPDTPPAPAPHPVPGRSGRTVVVFNPTLVAAPVLHALGRVLARHGCPAPSYVATTAEDPGGGQAAEAVRTGASLVVVCGGDGTVRAAADALAGTGVPLAVVPCGTGNLLARNLGLPPAPTDALDAALHGTVHPIDLGRVEGDGRPAALFAAMAGAGLDAAMVQRANESGRAKSLLGWPVYVLAALRVLRTPPVRVSIRLDGGPVLHRRARMVLCGNVGTVQGGLRLLPDARPDDGRLDLMVLHPKGPRGWFGAVRALLRGRRRGPGADRRGGPVEFFAFRRAEFTFETPRPRELDGDPVGPGRRLEVEVRPGALGVLLPVTAPSSAREG